VAFPVADAASFTGVGRLELQVQQNVPPGSEYSIQIRGNTSN